MGIALNTSSVCKEDRKIGCTDEDLSKPSAKDRPNSKELHKSSLSAQCFDT